MRPVAVAGDAQGMDPGEGRHQGAGEKDPGEKRSAAALVGSHPGPLRVPSSSSRVRGDERQRFYPFPDELEAMRNPVACLLWLEASRALGTAAIDELDEL